MTTVSSLILDQDLVAEIRRIEQASGRDGIFSGCVSKLESNLGEFAESFSNFIAHGDTTGAARAAHTLKGSSRQLGAQALGDLFAEIEHWAKVGKYAEAQRAFAEGGDLIAESLQALKAA